MEVKNFLKPLYPGLNPGEELSDPSIRVRTGGVHPVRFNNPHCFPESHENSGQVRNTQVALTV